jgi:hypothetical protein
MFGICGMIRNIRFVEDKLFEKELKYAPSPRGEGAAMMRGRSASRRFWIKKAATENGYIKSTV